MTDAEGLALRAESDRWLSTLCDWVRIPSVSADPRHRRDVNASAHFLADTLSRAGFPTVQVLESGPYQAAVYAHWPSGDHDAVRVLVYGHHDVQPASQADGWDHPPFEPQIRDGVLSGRGASDDKGNVAMFLLGLSAHLAATDRSSPRVDLTLLIEGEEESQSPYFTDLLDDCEGLLTADVIVVADAGISNAARPSISTGMRGLVTGELHVEGPEVDLHSGLFGGAVANPISELARILAAMHDENRRVAVPGFYDHVDEPTDAEREMLAALPFDERAWIRDAAHSSAPVGESGYTTLERIGMRPTAEVSGIDGGYTGSGSKTIVPRGARAKLSFRLVGRQDPAKVQRAVDEFVSAQARPGTKVAMHWTGKGVRPLVIPFNHPATRAARRALARAFGTEILTRREGGSGPEAELADRVGAPVVFFGAMTNDDRIHAPNERTSIGVLFQGAEAVAHLWRELAELGRSGLQWHRDPEGAGHRSSTVTRPK